MKLSIRRLPGRSLAATSQEIAMARGNETGSVAIVRVAVFR